MPETSESDGETLRRCATFDVFVDYALVGLPTEFPIALLPSERAELQIGTLIHLTGDSVDDRVGAVTELLEEPWVMVRLVGAHDSIGIANSRMKQPEQSL